MHADRLETASNFSVYEDLVLRGEVPLTAVRGQVAYQNGELVGRPGSGR